MSYRHLVEAVISAETKAKEVAAMKAKAQDDLRYAEEAERVVSANLKEAQSRLASLEAKISG